MSVRDLSSHYGFFVKVIVINDNAKLKQLGMLQRQYVLYRDCFDSRMLVSIKVEFG